MLRCGRLGTIPSVRMGETAWHMGGRYRPGAGKKRREPAPAHRSPSGGIGRHKGLEQFEPSDGNVRSVARQSRRKPWMPAEVSEPTPSQAQTARLGRCREQTAGTYGHKAMVKACSRPRTAPCALAAKAEVGRKSLAARRAGSIPASGTNSKTACSPRVVIPFRARRPNEVNLPRQSGRQEAIL